MLERDSLSREHAELTALATVLVAQIATTTPNMTGLSALRWRFNRVLLMHLAKEDKLLYPQLAQSRSLSTAQLARRFAAEVCGLAADYTAYMKRWPIERVEAEWSLFGRETRTILGILAARIAREEAELYPCITAAAG